MSADLPDLARGLRGVAPLGPVEVSGPRLWWGGPLDVEGLVLASTRAVASAFAGATGSRVAFDAADAAAWFGLATRLRIAGRSPRGFAPMSGFFPGADGWVRTHANYPHHDEALRRALGSDDVPTAIRALPALETERRVLAAGGLAVAVREPGDLAVPSGPWIRLSHLGSASPWTPAPGARPLAGLRVLDLTRVLAGPSSSRLLAALGADVLRVDPPHRPDLIDQHVATGFGKRSAVADLATEGERIHVLLDEAHVALIGYRFSALARFGVDPASLRERHPHLAVVSLDAWGSLPGWEGRRGFDSLVQAATGIARLCASDDGRPGALPVQALDMAAGLGMAAAAIALAGSGRSGWAHLSLAATARELLALGSPPQSVRGDVDRPLVVADSPFGRLETVAPPLAIDGERVRDAGPPTEPASSTLRWV